MKNIICQTENELGILNSQLELVLESQKVKKTKLCNAYEIVDLVIKLSQLTDCASESSFKIYSITKDDLISLSRSVQVLIDNFPKQNIC